MTPLSDGLKKSLPDDYIYIGKGGEFTIKDGDFTPEDNQEHSYFIFAYDKIDNCRWDCVLGDVFSYTSFSFAVHKNHPIVSRIIKE